VFGGKSGSGGKYEIHNSARPDDVKEFPAKFSGLSVETGDVATYFSPSGGGYGDPLERPPEQVLDDVLDDFITPENARGAYGVVLKEADNGYPFALDAAATDKLRASMRR
jgi:N-methylhydantoinase B